MILEVVCSDYGSRIVKKKKYNGCFFEKESPGHIHIWCYAHVLNLVPCDATTTNHASISLFGLVEKVVMFFRESYLRMDLWKKQ